MYWYNGKGVSFAGRLSLSQRVLYWRFHHTTVIMFFYISSSQNDDKANSLIAAVKAHSDATIEVCAYMYYCNSGTSDKE